MSQAPPSSRNHSLEPSEPSPPRPEDRFFGLSTAQVAGSALAAATSAFAASFLGVAGTIIGAVVGSLVATVGSAVYSHSLRQAGVRLRVVRPTMVTGTASDEPSVVHGPLRRAHSTVGGRTSGSLDGWEAARGRRGARARRGWARVAVGIVAGAALALGGITVFEQVMGHPLSDPAASGTSIGEAVRGGAPDRGPSPVQPATSPSTTPGTATPAPTGTPNPTGTTGVPSATQTTGATETGLPPAPTEPRATSTPTSSSTATQTDTAPPGQP